MGSTPCELLLFPDVCSCVCVCEGVACAHKCDFEHIASKRTNRHEKELWMEAHPLIRSCERFRGDVGNLAHGPGLEGVAFLVWILLAP